MERSQDNLHGEPELPEGYMTMQQFVAANALPDSEAEFLARAAADEVNRFNEELGREIPGIETPPPIHKYVKESRAGAPVLYFEASRLAELMGQVLGQVRENTQRYGDDHQ